jgi:hypothetical protein
VKNLLKALAACCTVFALAACGGGGGNASGTTGTTAQSVTTANVVTLTVVNTSGATVNNISYGAGQRMKAQYATSAGVAIANKLVSFTVTTNASAVTLSTAYATTDASGAAYVSVDPVSASTVGAATVSVAVGDVSASVDFSISATNVTLSVLALGASTLGSSGSTSVSVIASANSALAAGVPVAFSATCGTLTPSITQTDGSGEAKSTYSAVKSDGTSCSGRATLSAVASGSSQTNALTVSSPVASAVNFFSALPSQIYVLGSGATSQSIVNFKVLNAQGGNYSGAIITISLTANPGGVGLNASGATSNLTLTSNGDGLVTFTLFSGTVPGPIEVKATLADGGTYAVSKNLTVQSGPPSQNFFSLAAKDFNIEGRDYQGATTTLTVQAADRTGNPVPAGTVVNFTAEGGQVSPSCTMSLTDGIASCTATFSSQVPRPSNGRVSILAYTEGLKAYTDANGNNTFDTGDTLIDIGDAYRDDNENGAYDSGEFTVTRGGASTCNGSGGPAPGRVNTCAGELATTVRRQLVLIMSGSFASFGSTTSSVSQITFNLTDDGGTNPMPVGTSITASAVDNTPTNTLACTVAKTFPSTILNTSVSAGNSVGITLTGCDHADQIAVEVKTPKGNVTSAIFTIP